MISYVFGLVLIVWRFATCKGVILTDLWWTCLLIWDGDLVGNSLVCLTELFCTFRFRSACFRLITLCLKPTRDSVRNGLLWKYLGLRSRISDLPLLRPTGDKVLDLSRIILVSSFAARERVKTPRLWFRAFSCHRLVVLDLFLAARTIRRPRIASRYCSAETDRRCTNWTR